MKELNIEDYKDGGGHILIGSITDEHGAHYVKEENDKYFWCICDYDGAHGWEEIPKYLFDALIKFEVNGRSGVES